MLGQKIKPFLIGENYNFQSETQVLLQLNTCKLSNNITSIQINQLHNLSKGGVKGVVDNY